MACADIQYVLLHFTVDKYCMCKIYCVDVLAADRSIFFQIQFSLYIGTIYDATLKIEGVLNLEKHHVF